jgi:CRISPR-associated exonuclease Cas4
MSESPHPTGDAISISSLIMGCRCPRQLYYAKNEPFPQTDRLVVCQQVSRRSVDHSTEENLWDEIVLISPGISPEMREYFTDCYRINEKTPLPEWTDSDIAVHSDKYGVFGLIDKYHSGKKHISIVRTGKAPVAGCWPLDRVRIAAYLLCLRETTGVSIPGGFVEYIPDGIVRFCEPQPRDRRMLIQGLKNAREVQKGVFPPKPVNAPCRYCRYADKCEQPVARRLSDILF